MELEAVASTGEIEARDGLDPLQPVVDALAVEAEPGRGGGDRPRLVEVDLRGLDELGRGTEQLGHRGGPHGL